MNKWVVKDAEQHALNGKVIDSLDSDSTKDAPSINAVNSTIVDARKGRLFYISHVPGESVTIGNYNEWVSAGKPEAPSDFTK
ncbi:hypothetical protein DWX45_16525 [Erysipelotrichaceae bacterium AF19-24AC]|jgi:hypothetical protein|nr:hypothetical protein DWX45_16525 [Erysipelotrichaceae bacterium AF19-24AC]